MRPTFPPRRSVRRKRRPPPWKSLRGASHTEIQTLPPHTSCHHFAANQLRVLLAALAYVLIERMRTLALQGTELATAQVDTLRMRLLKLAAVLTRNTRRVRLYFASNWPTAAIFAQAMRALGST
jgi:hypothetical protein